MNRYSSYSKSPLEWMGVIPSHWIYTKNRFGFKKWKNGKNESDETSVLSLTIKGIKIKEDLSFGKSTESYIGHQLVEKGDIVFTPRDFDQTPILSDVSKYDGCISNLYIVDKTNERVLNHYINYYWYGLKYSVDYFKNFSHGIRFSFNRFQFDEIPLLIPPKDEQTHIISFLDTKTQKIDEFIEKTEQKIKLLKEKRTSLINHCVTKGLNSEIEMKESGVDWIGKIPIHWKISKFKFVSNLYTGNSLNDKQKIQYESDNIKDIPYVSSKDIDVNSKTVNYDNGLRIPIDDNSFKVSPKGSFLMVIEGGSSGKKMVFLEQDVCFVNKLCSFNSEENTRFLYYFVQSNNYQNKFKLSMSGLIGGVSISTLKNIELSIPSTTEQNQIVSFLDEQTQNIDLIIKKETQRIELLKEYRQSLISEVVTGKIDVRDWKE